MHPIFKILPVTIFNYVKIDNVFVLFSALRRKVGTYKFIINNIVVKIAISPALKVAKRAFTLHFSVKLSPE